MKRKFIVSIEKESDGSYIAYNTNGKGFSLIGTGKSIDAAKADFAVSMKGVAQSITERGEKVPYILTAEPEYKFNLTSLFEYYSMLNVSALACSIGINETLMRQYRKGDTYISGMQLKKIENGLHSFGKSLTNLRLV